MQRYLAPCHDLAVGTDYFSFVYSSLVPLLSHPFVPDLDCLLWLKYADSYCTIVTHPMLHFRTTFTPTLHRLSLGLPRFFYLDPLTKAMSLILYCYILDLLYHCTIWSLSWSLVRYNLLQVRLSLVDAHLPLHSPAYLVRYYDEYLNCTTRTLRP